MKYYVNEIQVKSAESGEISHLTLHSNELIEKSRLEEMILESYTKNKDEILVLDSFKLYEDGLITFQEHKDEFNEGAGAGLWCDHPQYPEKYVFISTFNWKSIIKSEYDVFVDPNPPKLQRLSMQISVKE